MERLKAELIANYDRLGLRASGKFERELEYEIRKDRLTMYSASHAVQMELGRRPGKFPPISAIEGWIEVKKGLPAVFYEKKKQYAFLIARKIAEEGITVPNQYNEGEVITSVVNEFLGNTIFDMIEELGEVFLNRFDFQSDIQEILQAAA